MTSVYEEIFCGLCKSVRKEDTLSSALRMVENVGVSGIKSGAVPSHKFALPLVVPHRVRGWPGGRLVLAHGRTGVLGGGRGRGPSRFNFCKPLYLHIKQQKW